MFLLFLVAIIRLYIPSLKSFLCTLCQLDYVWFLVNDLRDAQILFYAFFFQTAHISATNIELLLPEAVLIQFVSPDDDHDVLETCREL